MRTTFGGINIARRALQTQQRSLDVVGHNIANVNTPGYARQVAVHTATNPHAMPSLAHTPKGGQLGTGVQISQIARMRDEFVETRLRQENSNLGYWSALQEGLEQVELIFNEPSDHAIHNALEQYWDAMQELSLNPENEAARSVVVQRGEVLAESIRHTRGRLAGLRDDVNDTIAVRVSEINAIGQQIANLNEQIGKVSASGNNPNDLMDKRDVLLEELSEMINIDVVPDESNMVSVSISGMTLVQRNQFFALDTQVDPTSTDYARNQVVWADTKTPAVIRNGEVAGLIEMRDQEIDAVIRELEAWTQDFLNAINTVHSDGYDLDGNMGLDFFTVDVNEHASMTIRVNEELLNDPRKIAASAVDTTDGAVGNGDNALALAELRYNRHGAMESTLGDSFVSIISKLGVRSQKAGQMVSTEEALVTHLNNLREAVSGVSLDEEMANMIRYQHSYNAAARMMTTMDQTLDTIINRLGIVGR